MLEEQEAKRTSGNYFANFCWKETLPSANIVDFFFYYYIALHIFFLWFLAFICYLGAIYIFFLSFSFDIHLKINQDMVFSFATDNEVH